jgi:hypothetical protein
MEKKVFEIFGKVLISNKPKVNYVEINNIAIKHGFLVPKELCYEWLEILLADLPENYNSTFYKSWKSIVEKSRLELLLDQMIHYASTYGTNYQGETWVPEELKSIDFPRQELKVLEGITYDELVPKVQSIAYGNVAVKEDTIQFLEMFKNELDVDKIKIRQLKYRLIDENYQFKDGQECLNYILYHYFQIPLLIKNNEVLGLIRTYYCYSYDSKLSKIIKTNEKILSSVFLRNKDVFLTIKSLSRILHNPINRLRKLAKTNHKPITNWWLKLDQLNSAERIKMFNNASLYKLVQVYNAYNNPTGFYIIRNGNGWYKDSYTKKHPAIVTHELLHAISGRIKKLTEGKKFYLPKGIDLAMPMSEKNFIGDIPIGSTIDCADNNTMVGIYWRNEWGVHDLDLHAKTTTGIEIGWNRSYYDDGQNIVFSGDMTDANPEATEIIWFKKEPEDCIISVNEYNGNSKYKLRFFVAQEKATKFEKSYMVNPNSVIYDTEMEIENKPQLTLGFIKDSKFVFHSCSVGKGRVPSGIEQNILEHLVQMNYLKIKNIFELAGVEIVDSPDEDTVSLTNRGELLEFFS